MSDWLIESAKLFIAAVLGSGLTVVSTRFIIMPFQFRKTKAELEYGVFVKRRLDAYCSVYENAVRVNGSIKYWYIYPRKHELDYRKYNRTEFIELLGKIKSPSSLLNDDRFPESMNNDLIRIYDDDPSNAFKILNNLFDASRDYEISLEVKEFSNLCLLSTIYFSDGIMKKIKQYTDIYNTLRINISRIFIFEKQNDKGEQIVSLNEENEKLFKSLHKITEELAEGIKKELDKKKIS